jgi:predicted CopG family antitoxin
MSKSVRLSEEAYERLKALRCENEAISDVVLRLTGERSLLELAGILSDEQADALEDVIENRRTRQVELESVADEMRDA